MNSIIEYLNNPALLILSLEIIVFLLIVNIGLIFTLMGKKNKAMKALNKLIEEIKDKSKENKQKMAELMIQPGLTDPELIKKGLQELIEGQNIFYKDMIKAIRTQNLEDVSHLGNSVSNLINDAIALGRESGEGLVDTEAQEKLEQENTALTEEKSDLESKLQSTEDEMSVLMDEYKSMMNNAGIDEADAIAADSDAEMDEVSESIDISDDAPEDSILDTSIGESDTEEDAASITEEDEEAAA